MPPASDRRDAQPGVLCGSILARARQVRDILKIGTLVRLQHRLAGQAPLLGGRLVTLEADATHAEVA